MKPQFDLYFAGWYGQDIFEQLISLNYNQLLSFINDKNNIPKYFEAKKNGWKGKLLIDSGAFSVHKSGKVADVDAYIDFINKNHEYIDLYIQLDDIPGVWGKPKTPEQQAESPKKTWENYLYMRSKVIDKDKLLPVFHQGEDFKYLKQFLEYRDEDGSQIKYMCISSNKELDTRRRYQWYKQCYEIIENSSNPNIKIHSLGTQSQTHCELLPFTSADATTWIMAGVRGSIFTEFGTIVVSDRQKAKKECIANKLSYNVFEDYIKERGFTFDDLANNVVKRAEWNLKYLGKWAEEEREYKGPKTFKKARLF